MLRPLTSDPASFLYLVSRRFFLKTIRGALGSPTTSPSLPPAPPPSLARMHAFISIPPSSPLTLHLIIVLSLVRERRGGERRRRRRRKRGRWPALSMSVCLSECLLSVLAGQLDARGRSVDTVAAWSSSRCRDEGRETKERGREGELKQPCCQTAEATSDVSLQTVSKLLLTQQSCFLSMNLATTAGPRRRFHTHTHTRLRIGRRGDAASRA